MTFAVAGPAKTKEKLQPLLESMSRGVLDLGEQPQLANVMKITGDSSPTEAQPTEALDNSVSCREGGVSGRESTASTLEQHAGLRMLQWAR